MRVRRLLLSGVLLTVVAGYVGYGAWRAGGAAASDCTNSQVYTLNNSPFASGDIPILFVHGITSDPTTAWQKPELDGAASISSRVGSIPGTTVWAFDYHQWSEDWVTDSTIGPALANAITCLASATGKRVILVDHSMGGLATQEVVPGLVEL
jgi:pimeloyl-ACP methyl ester carboxylesterase